MPALDYQALRATISLERVLQLLGYQPSRRRGDQLRGPCPLHDPTFLGDHHCFSAHLGRHLFYCFRCRAGGNQLDLWRLIQRLPLHEASLHLCRQTHIEPPLLKPANPTKHSKSRNSAAKSSRSATA